MENILVGILVIVVAVAAFIGVKIDKGGFISSKEKKPEEKKDGGKDNA